MQITDHKRVFGIGEFKRLVGLDLIEGKRCCESVEEAYTTLKKDEK